MLSIPGYQVSEKIYTGIRNDVYRGYSEEQQRAVIIKVLKDDYPTLEEIAKIRQEYQIIKDLNIEGIVKAYSLEKYQYKYALILEDFQGQSLNQVITSQRISLKEFLHIAISLADTLWQLHQIPIIHKDINPSNIIFNRETQQVKISDFGIASYLSQENPSLSHFHVLEGTIAYISPEQTGRMNRSIDYRTDYYSLGITFYEMLVGTLPFKILDPIELIHSHLAKEPLPPTKVKKQGSGLDGEIPQVVSDIVMKLLAKNAEDRYQSSSGLKADLEICLSQLETKGNIDSFPIGNHDRPESLLIPQKLYGRNEEIEILMAAFERVSQGASELILVSGYSGIGKTSVVNEVHKPIVKARGYFISGKFDQLKRNIPYAAIIQAFKVLVQQLLTESDTQVNIWRDKLLTVLGANGRIITDVIPEVELIIGQQPEVPQVGATEAENRFIRVFQQFISVFSQTKHPLVIFLDDLQWSDSPSLKLIETLITDIDHQHLLIIGAYRNNEVTPIHPFIQTLERIKTTNTVVNEILIKPLDQRHVNQLVADTFNSPETEDKIKSLSELLFNKTQGNPFFLSQLLKTLYSEQLLIYNSILSSWQWDINKIQAFGITDQNVVELLARNIQKLPNTTQQVLKLAACLGNQFSLDMLAIVNQESSTVTSLQLWKALKNGLILPLSNAYKIPWALSEEKTEEITTEKIQVSYKFLHDRVQQAAYDLIPEAEKKEIHFKIGQLLLQNTTPEQRQKNVFTLVNQLNFGTHLLNFQSEKNQLIELNLLATQKAKAAAAYSSALQYVNVGLKLLATDSWESNYQLTFNLYREAIETEYLNSDFDRANILLESAFSQAQKLLDKVTIYQLTIQSYLAQNKMQKAIDTGLKVLPMLGIELAGELLSEIEPEYLAILPKMTDSYKIRAIEILTTISQAVYITNNYQLYNQIIFTKINLSIRYGNSPLSIIAYIAHALTLCAVIGKINSGYQFGQLAFSLLEKLNAHEIKSKVLDLFNGHIRFWKEPLQKTLESLLQAFNSGLETGDIIYTGYAALNYCSHRFFLGENLESVAQDHLNYFNFLQKKNLTYHIAYGQIGRQLILNLLNKSENKIQLIGEAFNEAEDIPNLVQSNNGTSLFYAYLAKLILAYLFQEPDRAILNATEATPYLGSVSGLITVAQHNFYYSLALLAHYSDVDKQEQTQYLNQVEANQEKMKNWADNAPENFQHKYQLVEAEKARVLGENWQAVELYDRAIQGAKQQQYTHEEALANELAAEFYFSHGKEKIAKTYLLDAYYSYIHWGAVAKVKDLEERYPQLLNQIGLQSETTDEIILKPNVTTTATLAALDLSSILKASQAISQEVMLDKLLDKLMKIILENSGAQNGLLLLSETTKLTIRVAASTYPKQVVMPVKIPVKTSKNLPLSVVNYVVKTKDVITLSNNKKESIFADDPYFQLSPIKSILCVPILQQEKLIGIIYLENNLATNGFNTAGIETIKLICTQAAISIENAKLYRNLYYSKLLKEAAQQMHIALQKEKELNELKSRFISMTSHEFRTPLTTILGSAELLRHYSPRWNEDKKQLHFDRIQNAVEHMIDLLEDVLILGKAEAGKLNCNLMPLDLVSFCDNLVEEIKIGTDSKKHQIVFSSEGECSDICLDEKLLRHILTNLLNNSIKYSPNGGLIKFDLICQKQEVIFRIQDCGIGIPKEDLPRLFDSFYRAKNTNEISGTGLGLSIVKKSVDLHGGTITVDSEVGSGTVFTVTISSSREALTTST
jgi:predicted ATPase/signal transduction histidine kinase/tRNA A-37 threonylcarbamoyl transferase component Bud32